MRSAKLFALSFLVASLTGSVMAANSVPGLPADPAGARLEQYPLQPGPLSTTQEATFSLRARKLTAPWTAYNHYRGLRGGRWVLETLPAGTLVLAAANGEPIYKADCGNRLVALAQCPICPAVVTGGTGTGDSTGRILDPGFWGRHPLLAKVWDFLGSLLLWLLALAILALLLLLLYRLLRRIADAISRWRNRPEPPVVPVAQVPPPTRPTSTPEASPAAAAAPPTSASTASTATPQPHHAAFYRGENGGPHKVNFAGPSHVMLTDHKDGRFTLHIGQ